MTWIVARSLSSSWAYCIYFIYVLVCTVNYWC